jgi:Uma2 family endonuclease
MTGWFEGAPDVAIEVVSLEKASYLEKKIELYLAHGGRSVWAVFPEQQVVRIFSASGESRLFDRTQTLEDPTVLPGFSASVSAIFEGI